MDAGSADVHAGSAVPRVAERALVDHAEGAGLPGRERRTGVRGGLTPARTGTGATAGTFPGWMPATHGATPMRLLTRFLARRWSRPGRTVLLVGLALTVPIAAVRAQSGPTAPSGGTSGSGPQSAVPAPLPPGAGADTPGGSARGGVIAPPPTSGAPGIDRGAPGSGTAGTPVIPPPGSPGGDRGVIPR